MTQFLDTFTALAAGMTDTRSKFKMSTYSQVNYTDQQLLTAYNGSGLVSRVVDMPAQDATRMWREWQAEAAQISKLEDVEKQFGIQLKLQDALVDARLFGDGYLFIDDGTKASEPLDPDTSKGLRFVVKVDRWQISEGEYDYDPLSEFYNRPSYYDLMGGDTALLRIHPSRIVHLVGRKRREYGNAARMGQSVVSAVMDDLKAVDAVMANVADMTMEAKVDVVKISGLLNKVMDPEELAAIMAKTQLAMTTKATNGALVMDMEDEDWQQKTMSFATIPDVIDRFQIAAAGAAQIPRSRLFGVQTGGLGDSGKSDTVDYYDRIKSMQENEIQPPMTVMDKMTVKTALGSIPDEVHYNWRSLWQMDDKTKQEIGKMIVDRYAVAVEKIGFPEELAYEQSVNELTEAGVAPGLEKAAKVYADANKGDDDADDAGDLGDGSEEDTLQA